MINRASIDEMKEICKLYNISEAEQILLIQLASMTQMVGISLPLAAKLFPALGAMCDMMIRTKDDKESQNKR